MGLTQYIRRNWLGFLGLLIGVAGIALSILFYSRSQVSRVPVFLVDPVRMEIINKDRVSGAPISVVRDDGRPIESDIFLARTYFWNVGELSIRKSNILQTLRVVLDEPKGEILDYKILKESRDVVRAEIKRSLVNPLRDLSISFDILEQGDGFSLQIIYVGKVDTTIHLEGTIEGVRSKISDSALRSTQFWKEYRKKLLVFALLIVILMTLQAFPKPYRYSTKMVNERMKKYVRGASYVSMILFLGLMLVALIFGVIVDPVKEAKRKARENISESIPRSLR